MIDSLTLNQFIVGGMRENSKASEPCRIKLLAHGSSAMFVTIEIIGSINREDSTGILANASRL